jgi:hypothetical protein
LLGFAYLISNKTGFSSMIFKPLILAKLAYIMFILIDESAGTVNNSIHPHKIMPFDV